MRFQPRSTPAIKLSLVTSIPMLASIFSVQHINTNIKLIQEKLNIPAGSASWIMNIETLTSLVITTMTGKLGERFGSTKLLTIGTFITGLANLFFISPRISKSFAAVLVLRALGAIGLGLSVPSAMPINFMLIKPGKLSQAIAINSMMLPVGAIISSISAGAVAASIGWNYMCVIVGCISLINCICSMFLLPYNLPVNKKAKIDLLSVFLLASGIVCFIIGLLSISQSGFALWLTIVLLVLGVLLIVCFGIYDQKYSKNQIFKSKLINRSVVQIELLLFLTALVSYGERYLVPFNLSVNLKQKPGSIGLLMAISGLSVFIFSPLTGVIGRKLITKYSMILLYSCYVSIMFINSMQIAYFKNVIVYTIFNFITMGIYVSTLILLQSHNYAQCPPAYAQQLGVLNQLMSNLGNSIGITVTVVLQQLIDEALNTPKQPYDPLSIAGVLWVYCGILIINIIISATLGLIRTERGKKGYNERSMQKTKGFEENLQNSDEMIEKQKFEGEEKLSRTDKFLNFFQPYVFNRNYLEDSMKMDKQKEEVGLVRSEVVMKSSAMEEGMLE
ncbi:Major_facilitator superfamily protein [Hexamita inflata]|uniref:Major_facilitator superfamily protein n=1 Tax=Hexamita inflata TaxID=28002 RepID=A0ABP1JRV1_9EUKA